MIYPLGTTVTCQLLFMNKAGELADLDTLKQEVFLSSRHEQVGTAVDIEPATVRTAVGTYLVDYQIPLTIDTDLHKSLTFIYTGTLEGISKVTTKTIQIDWK